MFPGLLIKEQIGLVLEELRAMSENPHWLGNLAGVDDPESPALPTVAWVNGQGSWVHRGPCRP